MSAIETAGGATTITPQELYERHRSGRPVELIDVRTPAEYRGVHATMARLVPLDELDPRAFEAGRRSDPAEPIYVICRSGARGEKARRKLLAAGINNVVNVAGGTEAWERAGLPVSRGRRVLPLDRQVQIASGSMVLLGFALGELVDPIGFYLSGFVGCGLVLAGLTGACPLGSLMARMPWNRAGREAPSCSA